MLPANCRYYPTCSEYATWQFEFNPPHIALLKSTTRILRCNQLFAGGIDYPIVYFKPPKIDFVCVSKANYGKITIKYWLIPIEPDKYIVTKDFDATTIKLST
jgi:putative membrane protein insertion efficiency factor